MIAVKTIDDATKRYVFNAARSFLDGAKNLSWIQGVVLHSGLSREETLRVLQPRRTYGDPARANDLFDWLNSARW